MAPTPIRDNPELDLRPASVSACLATSEIRLECPRCRTSLDEDCCRNCGFQLRDRNGIADALPQERLLHYGRFIDDYQRIRAAEGRGSQDDAYYLELPYNDVSGRNTHQWRIRSRSYDCLLGVLNKTFPERDARILDLGAGNGWMSYRLAAAGYRPYAVDLLVNELDGLGAARHYRRHLQELFPRFRAELPHLPFQDGQFDAAVFNASFHYAEDCEATLREALRCVRIGGVVIICDTPWYSAETSGQRMLSERRATFLRRYGTASHSIDSLEYLTDKRLRELEEQLSIRWITYSPHYGFRWAMRPIVAWLRNRREPSRFRIYVARKTAA